jgi:hypothetical protein
MARADQIEIALRIVIDRPVIGVLHSLQTKDDLPLDPKTSHDGAPLVFDFPIRIAPGPKFYGDQVKPQGPERRFVYIRIGQYAGDPSTPWARRMKIDIHDIAADLLASASTGGGIIETTIPGTARDGSPACGTVRPTMRRIVDK